MANIIDNVAIQIDADLTLFDKKFQGIKNELKKIQKITVDIEQTGKAGGGAGIGALGAAGLGAGLGAGLASKAASTDSGIKGITSAKKIIDESREAMLRYKKAAESVPPLDLTGQNKIDIGVFNNALEELGIALKELQMSKIKIRILANFKELSERAKLFYQQMKAVAVKIGVAFKKAFNYIKVKALIAFTAITAYGAKAVMSFAAEEKALRNLGNAIDQYGEASADALPALKEMANAIQEQTGIEDDVTLARMASLRLLGVETDKLGDASKAVIGLTKAGIGEETAIRAVAAARKGDFTMLTRYIPALRVATTEQGKAAAINDFVTKQYRSQKDELDTLSGRYNEFKTWVGEANEAVGKAISENLMLQNMFANLTARIKLLIESGKIKEWVDKIIASMRQLIQWLVQFGNAIKTIWNYKFDIALTAIAIGLTKMSIAAIPAIKNIWALVAATFAYSKALGVATTAQIVFGTILKSSLFVGALAGLAAIIAKGYEARNAFDKLSESMRNVKSQGDDMFKVFGTRNASTLKTATDMLNSGDPKKIATIKKLYPKIVAEIEKAKNATKDLKEEQEKPIDIAGVAPMKELEDATKDTQKAFEALKQTVSQGSGATSIFDSVLEGMNTLIGGAGTARIPEYLQGITKTMNNRIGNGDTGSPELLALQKIFDRVSGYFKDVGEISNSIGTVDVNGSTGSSQQVSMATQIVNAIQNQTETLVKSLTGIEKSIGNIAFVL